MLTEPKDNACKIHLWNERDRDNDVCGFAESELVNLWMKNEKIVTRRIDRKRKKRKRRETVTVNIKYVKATVDKHNIRVVQ